MRGDNPDHSDDWDDPAAAPDDWQPLDLLGVWDADTPPPSPRVVPIDGTNGVGLFYAGKINALWAPSGSGKTWVALLAVRHALHAGKRVVVIDFEDHAHTFVHRLRTLGITRDQAHLVAYVQRPASPVTTQRWQRLLNPAPAIVVLDGVTGWYQLHHLDPDSAIDTETYKGWLEIPAAQGACVLTVDQATKAKDGSAYPLGSQHKRAAFTGVGYEVRPKDGGFTTHRGGLVELVLWKDRAGGLPVAQGNVAATVRMTPVPNTKGGMVAKVLPGAGWNR